MENVYIFGIGMCKNLDPKNVDPKIVGKGFKEYNPFIP